MNIVRKDNTLNYFYTFSTIVHFKRIINFLRKKTNQPILLFLLINEKNFNKHEELNNIIHNFSNLKQLIYLEKSKLHFLKKFTSEFNNLTLLVDKFRSLYQFKIASMLSSDKKLSIDFIEHNLCFHWGYDFNHKNGYNKSTFFLCASFYF